MKRSNYHEHQIVKILTVQRFLDGPCGDSNAGICLRSVALYPLSYRGLLPCFYPNSCVRSRPPAFCLTPVL